MTRKGTVALSPRQLWGVAFTRWGDVTAPDLHEVYGLDDMDPTFWERPWRPMVGRILGLLSHPHSRLRAALIPATEE